jgi:hypothetical protein
MEKIKIKLKIFTVLSDLMKECNLEVGDRWL